jgi:hypothetical protein
MVMKHVVAVGLPLLALSLGIGAMAAPAMAQADGEERCSPDGYVMTFQKRSYGSRWDKSLFRRCDADGGSSRSRRDEDDDRPRSRRASDDDGSPEDGDRKCVAHEILEFRKFETMRSMTGWKRTFESC